MYFSARCDSIAACSTLKMANGAAASAGLIAALKGSDQEALTSAITAAQLFDETPGDDRQRLRGSSLTPSSTAGDTSSFISHCNL